VLFYIEHQGAAKTKERKIKPKTPQKANPKRSNRRPLQGLPLAAWLHEPGRVVLAKIASQPTIPKDGRLA
jgi:hypothetical protein